MDKYVVMKLLSQQTYLKVYLALPFPRCHLISYANKKVYIIYFSTFVYF
jgi:hypothetical protein